MTRKKNPTQKKTDAPPDSMPADTPGTTPDSQPGNNTRLIAILLGVAVLGCAILLGFLLPMFMPAPAPAMGSGNLTVYFFYGEECPHCHNVTPLVRSLRDKYPDVGFQLLEIWHNDTNNALYKLLNHKLGLELVGVPQVIVGNVSLVGEDQIHNGLEQAILAQKGNLTGTSMVGAEPVYGSAGTNATITATYFYGNGCSHCEAVKPLIADLEARYPDLRIEMLEINDNPENRRKFLAIPLPEGEGTERRIPAIFIGSHAMIGEEEVQAHFEEYILAEKERMASGTPASLENQTAPSSGLSVRALYFYSDSCSHCEKIKPVLANISARYPDLTLTRHEVNHDAESRELFNELSSLYGIQNPGIPTIFIGNGILVGEAEITAKFEGEILAERQRVASGIPSRLANLTPAGPGSQPATPAFSPFMVIGAALVDSMNPCGLSVLVFLLISMAAAGDRKRILLVGGTYIAAMFLFHLLVGIGLFSAFALSGLAKPFSIIGGIIALVLGIITLIDVLRNRETYLLSIPESGKGMLGTYIRQATMPAAFVLGILAGILGFSCTGGIYISILGLMGRDMTVMAGLPWLVLYNIVFVLPLVLVTLLAAYGISPERAESWRTTNKRAVRVVIGLILVALGVIILSGWLG
jgi:cytochrome c biogenesis protein CcdA/thiol-disulfide isomerase/thioredoxin